MTFIQYIQQSWTEKKEKEHIIYYVSTTQHPICMYDLLGKSVGC